MKRLLLAGVALLTLGAASAFAADLPARMPAKAPAFLPAGYNWSGWYLGINGGYGWGRSHWTDTVAGTTTGGFDLEGGLIGSTLGINWQRGPWVFGLESDGDWSDISGSTPTTCAPNCETRNNWLATFRGRVGYAFDRWLPYVTGGLAVGDIDAGLVGLGRDNSTQAGWTVGGGVEWAIAGPWTAKVEYLHTDLGTMSCSIASCGGVGTTDVDFTANIVRGGINYRFGPAL